MLHHFIALLALLNAMMGGIHNWPHMAWFPDSMQTLFGWISLPLPGSSHFPGTTPQKIGNLLGHNAWSLTNS